MKFVHLQTILSRRHSGKRKFSQNKGFPTVKGFTYKEIHLVFISDFKQRCDNQFIRLTHVTFSGDKIQRESNRKMDVTIAFHFMRFCCGF